MQRYRSRNTDDHIAAVAQVEHTERPTFVTDVPRDDSDHNARPVVNSVIGKG